MDANENKRKGIFRWAGPAPAAWPPGSWFTAEEALRHPARNRLTRFVGMQGEPLPEASQVALEPGNRLLLCTGGLTNMVDDRAIMDLLAKGLKNEATCRRLVRAANRAGGTDNITVLLIEQREPRRWASRPRLS